MITIVFRMDDYSAISNTELELNILEIFQERKIGVTFGVVPYVCSGSVKDLAPQTLIPLPYEKGEILKANSNLGFLDIALHGYSHQANNLEDPSEFVGLDYNTQFKRLAKGKALLEEMIGRPLKSFIPPWNKYDYNTLAAIEDLGFVTLSAGWKGVVTKDSRIRFIPATCDLNTIQDAINSARISSDKRPVIVSLFHHYDFTEFKDIRATISLKDLSDLLDWLITQKDLRLASLSEANESINDLSAHRFSTLESWRALERFLPEKLREKKPVLIYHEITVYRKTLFKFAIIYQVFFIAFLLLSFSITTWLIPQSIFIAKLIMNVSITMTTGIIIYSLRNFRISPKGLKVSLASLSFCVGILFAFLLN